MFLRFSMKPKQQFKILKPMDDSIREDLSNVPFEELLKIREKIGTKVYRHTVLNQFKSRDKNEFKHADSSGEDEQEESIMKTTQMKMKKTSNYKRQNHSQPIETSSKKLDSRFNFQRIQPSDELNRLKKAQTFRDPRFDPNCGQFKPDKFKQNYTFLSDLKCQELDALKRKLKKAKNPETKSKLQFLIKRLSNQIKADEEATRTAEIEKRIQKTKFISTKPNENINNEEDGDDTIQRTKKKKVKFVNKGLLKRTRLVEKYKQLKQSGQLDKYLAKKRKKLAMKDRWKFITPMNQPPPE